MILLPLIAVFFLSGAAALLFENLWFHQAGIALGNSVWASSLVLAAFMGGLALGNGLVARLGTRIARPVRLYALLEIAIGATGLALVHLIPQLTPLFHGLLAPFQAWPLLLNGARLLVAFGLLMVPATAMGATLPLLVAAFYRRDPHFGRVLGRLYGWNTLGALAGAVAGPLFAVEAWGVRGSALFAASLNGIAACVAIALAPRIEQSAARHAAGGLGAPARWLLLTAFLAGGALLGLEVVWFRFLLLFVRGTDMAFAAMLAVVLAGIGLGGLCGARWLAWRSEGARDAPAVAAACGALCIGLYVGFEAWIETPVAAMPFAAGMLLMFPVALLSGVLFTLLGEALHRETGEEMRSAGWLTLANTSGAMVGPLLAGFVLLPRVGMEQSLRALAAAYLLVGAAALAAGAAPPGRAGRATLAAVAGALVLALALFPSGMMTQRYLANVVAHNDPGGSHRVVEVREGLTETITYLQSDAWGQPISHRMLTNGHSMSGTTQIALRYMRLFVWWPVALHPAPRSALLISYGVGVTAKALTDTRELERIDVVDISRDILEMNRIVYPDPADHPLNDPRVEVHVEDGRYFLATTERRFDIITGEPPPPKMAGIVNLYTYEYFELVRDRLAEGGIVTYWLPVHSLLPDDARAIIRAFCDAFPDCSLWNASALNWMLVGTRNAAGPVSRERFERQWRDPVVGTRLREVGLETPEQLGALFMADREILDERTRDVAPLTDDFPKRLSDESPFTHSLLEVYLPWMDTAAARDAFLSSDLVGGLWPPDLEVETLAWFEIQALANRFLLGARAEPGQALRDLEQTLARPALRTLPLWLMGSGAIQVRLAERAVMRGDESPELAFHMGAAAVADRNPAAAVAWLETARRSRHRLPWSVVLEIRSRCLSGRVASGEALLAEAGLATELWDDLRLLCASAERSTPPAPVSGGGSDPALPPSRSEGGLAGSAGAPIE